MLRVVKLPGANEPLFMKLAYFTGRTAWRIHQVIVHPLFLMVFTIALIYGLMRLVGLLVLILRHGDLLLRIR
jgi:hypothetical protein